MQDNQTPHPPEPPRPTPAGPPRRGVMDIRPRGGSLSPARPTAPVNQPVPQLQPAQDSELPRSEHLPSPPIHEVRPKGHAPKLAVALAFIIAIILAVLTVGAYYYTRDTTSTKKTDSTDQTESESAHTTDVDEATKAVDEATAPADLSEEFPESDLSDQALGL